ncbi:PQQ-binding-like beta-propeller repeat protein [Flaviaesturariibacter amylovorans]|uniref:Pyrrolo-quinoline quinone repeat domain-containing protein n=1 Tax=Flaviaesturariibacter amylovorans TaxID=1084520 RepID=A0ABP8GBC8_9BACT
MRIPFYLLAALLLGSSCSRPDDEPQPTPTPPPPVSDPAALIVVQTRHTTQHPFTHRLTAYTPQGSVLWQRNDLYNATGHRYIYRNGIFFLGETNWDQASSTAAFRVRALRATDGSPLWTLNNVQAQYAGLAASDSILYLAVIQGNATSLRAYHAQSGALRWQLPQPRSIAHLRFDNGTLYYVSFQPLNAGATVVAFDPVARQERWSAPLGSAVTNFVSGIRLSADAVYLTNAAGAVRAYDRATGALRWTGSAAFNDPHAMGNTVLVRGSQGAVAGLDPATGATRWTWQQSGGTPASTFSLADGTVTFSEYVSQTQHYLTRLDAGTGTLRWRYPVPDAYMEVVANGDRAYALRTFISGSSAPPFGKIVFYDLANGRASDSVLINDQEIAQLSVVTASGAVLGSGGW